MGTTARKVTDREDWQLFIEKFEPDVFHTYAFNNAYAEQLNGKAVLFVFFAEDGKVISATPLVERPVLGTDKFDLASCYGYSGILSDTVNYNDIVNFFENGFGSLYPEYITLFLRSNPFLYAFEEGSDVIFIDISEQEDDFLKTYRYGHRSEIRKISPDVLVKEAPITPDNIEIFYNIYCDTMDKVDASLLHRFSIDFFSSLSAQSQFGFKLIFVYYGELVIAGCMFLWNERVGHYFLSGSVSGYEKFIPGKLLIYKCNEFSKALGLNILSLGGGLGGSDDSLSQFKRGFSKAVKKYQTHRIILQHEVYAQLSDQIDPEADSAFFPRYRKDE